MIISLEIKKRAKAGAGPILGILAVAYFSYHLVEGDRGLFAYLKLQHEIDRAESVYQLTENEKQALEKRVALLRPENLDVDMLEERSRDVLGLAHPDEIVIYMK
ncbi:septum formation initiator family protein [Sneathiella sp.]|uniref:FtsB family cell division protein n=1 Tax=Sneathiella sp. TaxID=1964365 RepID=UPI0026200DF5|nr:septum formation initiator family protein [Sneathiella sp.]MDF2369103.1 septum formation initiator family protein [Sneathiella sp.]